MITEAEEDMAMAPCARCGLSRSAHSGGLYKWRGNPSCSNFKETMEGKDDATGVSVLPYLRIPHQPGQKMTINKQGKDSDAS